MQVQSIISPSSKSAKMLNSIGKYNSIAFSGLTIQDKVSNMLKMLNSNEHEMIKFNTMMAKLNAMQQQYSFMQFTLQMEMMREMMKHKFKSKPNEKNMLKGFTPFVLQKMDEMDEIDLSHLEEELEQANYPSWNDINKKSNSVKNCTDHGSDGFFGGNCQHTCPCKDPVHSFLPIDNWIRGAVENHGHGISCPKATIDCSISTKLVHPACTLEGV